MSPTEFQCVNCGHRFGIADDAFTAACPVCGSAGKLDRDDREDPEGRESREPEMHGIHGASLGGGMVERQRLARL